MSEPFWTRETIIAAMRAWFQTFGEAPRSRDWAASSIEGERRARYRRLHTSQRSLIPSSATVYARFGSWNAAVEAAGLTPRVSGGQRDERPDVREECSKGHPLDDENTYIDWKGKRRCRRCQLRHQTNSRLRRRARARGLILGDPE